MLLLILLSILDQVIIYYFFGKQIISLLFLLHFFKKDIIDSIISFYISMLNKIEVATKLVVLNNNNEALILVRSMTDEYAWGQYDLPWGRLNLWESPLDWVKRETFEESGIEIQKAFPINTWSFSKWETQIIGITFLSQLEYNPEVQLSYEHSLYSWVWLDEIEKNNFPDWLQNILKLAFHFKK